MLMLMLKDQNPTRTERRKLQIRERIISGALEAFGELGYGKTTVENITTRADIGHGTFYQYFKNKQELLGILADDMTEQVQAYIHPQNKQLSILEIIKYGIKGILESYINHKIVVLTLKEAIMFDGQFEEKWLKIHQSLFKRIERHLTGFMQKGYCRDLDVGSTIIALTCMLEGYAHHLMTQPPDSVDIDAAAGSLASLCYHAIFKNEIQLD